MANGCLFCGHGNADEARFCMHCGSPLDWQRCPKCGGVDKRTAASCHRCGHAYGAPGAAETNAAGHAAVDLQARADRLAATLRERSERSREPLPFRVPDSPAAPSPEPPPVAEPPASPRPPAPSDAVTEVPPADGAPQRPSRLRERPARVVLIAALAVAAVALAYLLWPRADTSLAVDTAQHIPVAPITNVEIGPPVPEPAVPAAPAPAAPAPAGPATAAPATAAPAPAAPAPAGPATAAPATAAPIAEPAPVVPRAARQPEAPLPAMARPSSRPRPPAEVRECTPAIAALGLCTMNEAPKEP